MKIKKGDQVIIITGKQKGFKSKVKSVMPKTGKVVVENAAVAVLHKKGETVNKEMAIDISNVAILDPKLGTPTKVGYKVVDNKKVRYAKKSGEILDS